MTLVKGTWHQFCNSCENAKRGGMGDLLDIHVWRIREYYKSKAKGTKGELIAR